MQANPPPPRQRRCSRRRRRDALLIQEGTGITEIQERRLLTHDATRYQIQMRNVVPPYFMDFQYLPNNMYDAFFFSPEEPGGFGGIVPYLAHLLRRMIMCLLLFVVSSVSYAIFYHLVMPSYAAIKPLHFDYYYSHLGQYHHPPDCYPSKQRDNEAVSNRFKPWAVVDLSAKHESWQEVHFQNHSHPVVTPSSTNQRILSARQHYLIEVDLILPESHLNRDMAGIFVVETTILTDDAHTNATRILAISRRSIRFPHSSAWIQVMQKFCLLPALLVGAMAETKTVRVAPFRQYVESAEYPLRLIQVKLLSPHSDGRPMIEVVGGEIRISKELNFVQEFLKDLFWFSACLGTCLFATMYALLAMLLQNLFKSCTPSRSMEIYDEEPPCDLNMDEFVPADSWHDSGEGDWDQWQPHDGLRPGDGPTETSSAPTGASHSAFAPDPPTEAYDANEWEDLYYPTDHS